jgi:transcriptional regulator with XRE-family HTH domain
MIEDSMPETQSISFESFPEIGHQLTKAREAAGKTSKECAQVLGIPLKKYQKMETGVIFPSLPEMESIAYFLGVLPDDLLKDQTIEFEKQNVNTEQLQQFMQLRHRILSATLQLVRSQKNLSLKEVSSISGISTARIKRYEMTSTPIPLNDLSALCKALETTLPALLDRSGFLAERQKKMEWERSFHQLPVELQDFITDPENLSFLHLAVRLKETGIENLESLAAGLQQLANKVKE